MLVYIVSLGHRFIFILCDYTTVVCWCTLYCMVVVYVENKNSNSVWLSGFQPEPKPETLPGSLKFKSFEQGRREEESSCLFNVFTGLLPDSSGAESAELATYEFNTRNWNHIFLLFHCIYTKIEIVLKTRPNKLNKSKHKHLANVGLEVGKTRWIHILKVYTV